MSPSFPFDFLTFFSREKRILWCEEIKKRNENFDISLFIYSVGLKAYISCFSLVFIHSYPLSSYNSLSQATSLPTPLLSILKWLLLQPVSHYHLPLPPIDGSMMSSLVSEVKIPAKTLLPIFRLHFVERESTLSKITYSREVKKYLQHSYRKLKNRGFPSSFFPKTMLPRVGDWMNLQRFLNVSKWGDIQLYWFSIMWIPPM